MTTLMVIAVFFTGTFVGALVNELLDSVIDKLFK